MTLALAMLIDAIFGEPRWLWSRLPHPAVLMGRAVDFADRRMNLGGRRRAKGVLAMVVLGTGALSLGTALSAIPGQMVDVVIAAIFLAQRSLVEHVCAVASGLRTSIADGRQAVAMIVSRDTSDMNETAVARSAIESAAENFSDGFVAPAFWFLIGGLPGLFLYKITNTADSMIGYRTPRHEDFGWAAARFDDLLNLVPARLTAAILWLVGGMRGSWPAIIADARRHKSPNAGWPEAALSRSIDVSLAGPRSYDGKVQSFPFVNPEGRAPGTVDIVAAVRQLWRAWGLSLALAICIAFV